MKYLLIAIGFLLLIKGADFFVEGASSIAKMLRIPSLIIGLTIVAFGTSAPEAAVSITSALQGQNDIAIGNIVGSNIFNLLFVAGVAAFISPLKVKTSIIAKEFPFMILSSVVLLVLSQDVNFQGATSNSLTRADGIMLLVLFGIFMYYLIELALNARKNELSEEDVKVLSTSKSIMYSIGGIIGIVIGGKLVVDAASSIAITWGMSENLVGLTIVAVGTSLPELVTSIVAARKGQSDIALGNVIGSNIFNVFFILGISALIHPISVNGLVLVDMLFMLIVTVVAYVFAITKKKVNKVEGTILSVTYILYMIFIIMRN
ncbi:MAG: calcium/sodium antiporter [Cellulosilyticaceae bacterium]